MLNSVPFFRNLDEWHCIHSAMQSVIKHYSGNYYSQEFINALLCPERDLWVWPLQVVKALDEVGLFARFLTANDLSIFSNQELFNKTFGGCYADKTHFESVRESFDYIQANNLHEKQSLSLADMERFLSEGCLPIIILGTKKRLGKYVVLTGFDANNFYYHETGPDKFQPNKAISKEKFIYYWSQEPSMNAAIIVYGKKQAGTYVQLSL